MERPQVHVTDPAADYVAHAGRFSRARPIEHNVLVTVLAALRDANRERTGLFGCALKSEAVAATPC
jgi:hypothetical protein